MKKILLLSVCLFLFSCASQEPSSTSPDTSSGVSQQSNTASWELPPASGVVLTATGEKVYSGTTHEMQQVEKEFQEDLNSLLNDTIKE